MKYGNQIIKKKKWLPVPDEGWGIDAATAGNPQVQFLNGIWNITIRERDKTHGFIRIKDGKRFAWNKSEDKLLPIDYYHNSSFEDEFYRIDTDFKQWKQITVPSNWETEALSKHIFAHCSLPLDDVVGYYRRKFQVSNKWLKNGRVILQAEGIASSAEIFINEKKVIYHDGGFVPFQVDITEYLKTDENLIAIKVVKADISTVHDNSGQWMLSGIYKDIFIFHIPEEHITDLRIVTDFDSSTGEGYLDSTLCLQGKANKEYVIKTVLYDWESDMVIKDKQIIIKKDSKKINYSFNISDIKPWSPEEPNLYRLEFQLIDKGSIIERVREEIGFYRISAEEGIFKLNDKHIVIRGVTRHDILQSRGRALNTGDMVKEIRMMKAANITGVRSHPYPFDTRFVKLCARYGLLVATEYCLCGYNSWGNPWTVSEKMTYPRPESEMDQNYRMLFNERYHYFAPLIYARYKNMTAIFAWGLSNESGFCEIFLPVAKFLSNNEKKRLIYSAGERDIDFFGKHEEKFKDIIVNNYLTADSEHYPDSVLPIAEKVQQSLPRFADRPRPMFYTEAAHLFCNRDNYCLDPGLGGEPYGRCFQKEFNAFSNNKYVGGIFIFEWSDQAVMQKGDPEFCDSFLNEWSGYTTFNQNLKGIIGPDHEPKPAYYHVKRIFSQVKVNAIIASSKKLILQIENNYYWRNLKTFEIRIMVTNSNIGISPSRILDVDIKPGQKDEYVIDNMDTELGNCYRVVITDKLCDIEIVEKKLWYKPKPWIDKKIDFISSRLVNDKETIIRGIKYQENVIEFVEPLELTLGEPPTEIKNRVLGMGHLNDLSRELEETVNDSSINETKLISYNRIPNKLEVVKEYILDKGVLSSTFTVTNNDKKINIQQRIEYKGSEVATIQLGMKLALPANYQEFAWLRKGLWSEYPDDHPDRTYGRIVLGKADFPVVNPFIYPSFSEKFMVRNIREGLLSGVHVPGFYFSALQDNQKLIVSSMPDHRRDIYLVLEHYSTLPYHEFSYNTRTKPQYGSTKYDLRESYQGVKQLKSGDIINNIWEIGLIM